MEKEYDQITAFHYSAFRPALHFKILNKCLEKDESFSLGLDVGCGTGQSSIALTSFCEKVIGVEPSKAMLQKTIQHPQVKYQHSDKKHFDFSDDYFDIITFAGSLYYVKSQSLLDEVIRVTKSNSKIIVYDFELLLDFILEKLDLKNMSNKSSNYNHKVSFDNLVKDYLNFEKKFKGYLSLEISISNLSHLLLSSKTHYHLLLQAFGKENPYNKISQKLHLVFKTKNILVDTITYSTVYQNVK